MFFFPGIPTCKCNFCGYRGPSFGRCHASLPCATYFDTDAQAAKDASASRDKLIDILNRIERFFRRLEIYTGITPTTAMTDMIVEIMVEVLTIPCDCDKGSEVWTIQ
jgi:transposase